MRLGVKFLVVTTVLVALLFYACALVQQNLHEHYSPEAGGSSTNAAAASAAESEDQLFARRRLQLRNFYRKFDPSKIEDVDRFLKLEWNRLNAKLLEKYGQAADTQIATTAAATAATKAAAEFSSGREALLDKFRGTGGNFSALTLRDFAEKLDDELQEMLGLPPMAKNEETISQWRIFFARFDMNGDQLWSWSEFESGLLAWADKQDELLPIFQKIDRDNDGFLNSKDLTIALRNNEEVRLVLRLPAFLSTGDGSKRAFDELLGDMGVSSRRDGTVDLKVSHNSYKKLCTGEKGVLLTSPI